MGASEELIGTMVELLPQCAIGRSIFYMAKWEDHPENQAAVTTESPQAQMGLFERPHPIQAKSNRD